MYLSTAKLRACAPTYEPAAYLSGEKGYFFLGQKYPGEIPKFRQVAFKLTDRDTALDDFFADPMSVGLRPNCDTYISQGVLASADNREAASVISLSTVWLELDLEKAGLDPIATLPLIEARRIEAGLPPFSILNFSGRGIHGKLNFADPIGPAQYSAWYDLISSLAVIFKDFGADTSVFDVSRVLRLPGTLNTKAGEYCRTLQVTGDTYDFDTLCQIVRPYNAAAQAAAKTPKAGTARYLKLVESKDTRAAIQRPTLPAFRPKLRLYKNPRLDWDAAEWTRLVLSDLEQLMYMRFEGGILPAGERDELLFPAFVYLAGTFRHDHNGFIDAARDLCGRHCDWSEGDFLNCISSLARRHRADCDGEPAPADFTCHVYTWRASKLIARLKISAQEQARLRALVDDSGRRERDRIRQEAKRRAAGTIERDDYLQAAATRRDQAAQLHQDGHSVEEIAQVLGVSKRSVYGYLAEARELVQSPSAYAVGETRGEPCFSSLPDTANAFETQESAQQAFAAPVNQGQAAAVIEKQTKGQVAGSGPQAALITPLAVVEEVAQAVEFWGEVARRCFIEQQAEAVVVNSWGDDWADMEAILDGQGRGAGQAGNGTN